MTKSKKSLPLDLGQLFFICLIIAILVGWALTSGADIMPESSSIDDDSHRESLLELIGRWRYENPDGDIYLVLSVGYSLSGEWSTETDIIEKFTWSRVDNTISIDYLGNRDPGKMFIQDVDKNHLSILTPTRVFYELFEIVSEESIIIFERCNE